MDYKKEIKQNANDIINTIVRDDYVEAERFTKRAIASNIAGRITNQITKIKQENK